MIELSLENVSVEFPVFNMQHRSLKKRLISITTGGRILAETNQAVCVRALDNINMTLQEGERVALIGHNGAGKTTLLRMLAGIYEPTGGIYSGNGHIVPLLDVATGMDHEASGFDNIRLRGAYLGMTSREIAAAMDDIIAFTDLGDYLAMPIRTYSMGMLMRLAFAISTACKPDVILMDEMVSVGDAQFMAKAQARMNGLMENAKIIVFSSHNTDLLKETCTRGIWLEHGKIVMDGAVDTVIDAYLDSRKAA